MTREMLVSKYHAAKDAMNACKTPATTLAYHEAKDALNAFQAQVVKPKASDKNGPVVVAKASDTPKGYVKPATPAEIAPIVEKPKASSKPIDGMVLVPKADIIALIVECAKHGNMAMVERLSKLL